MATRRALLIGIDRYPAFPQEVWLHGCGNDVDTMEGLLVATFGFAPHDVAVLSTARGQAVTGAEIRAAIDALVAASEPEDAVVLYYAGHGSRVVQADADENEAWDQTLVPSDVPLRDLGSVAQPWEAVRDILDDEVRTWLARLAARTDNVTVLLDSCHSGSASRGGPAGRVRSLPPVTVAVAPPGDTRSRGGPALLTDRTVVIAACADPESAHERALSGPGGPEHHGLFTWHLVRALAGSSPTESWRSVLARLVRGLAADEAPQHPQARGPLDLPPFQVQERPGSPFWTIEKRTGDTVTFPGGRVHGLLPGDGLQVFGPATEAPVLGAPALGTLFLTECGGLVSAARVDQESAPGAVAVGSRAFLVSRSAGEGRLRVRVRVEGPLGDELRAALGLQPMLEAITVPDMAAVEVHLLGPRGEPGPSDAVPQAGALDRARWIAVDAAGRGVLPAIPAEVAGSVDAVLDGLRRLARARALAALDDDIAGGSLRGAISGALVRWTGTPEEGAWVAVGPDPATGEWVMREDEVLSLRLTHTAPTSLYLHLVELTDDLRAVRLTGDGPQSSGGVPIDVPGELWEANRTYTIGGAPTAAALPAAVPYPLRMAATGDWPYTAEAKAHPVVLGRSTTVQRGVWKAFATLEPLTLPVVQRGVRGGPTLPGLGALLRVVDGSPRERGAQEPPAGDDVGAWTVASFPFRIEGAPATARGGDTLSLPGAELRVPGWTVSAWSRNDLVARGSSLDAVPAARPPAAGPGPDPEGTLDESLRRSGMKDADQIVLSYTGATHTTTRGGASTHALLPQWDRKHGAVLATDARGWKRWLLPDLAAPLTTFPLGQRGALDTLLTHLRLLQFDPPAAFASNTGSAIHDWRLWEEGLWPHHLRTMTPGLSQVDPVGPTPTPAQVSAMAGQRTLLLLHGFVLRSHLAFGTMTVEALTRLQAPYSGRVLAWDHPTLTVNPLQNAQAFVDALPPGIELDLDLLCYSRGGLVGRCLAEQQHRLALGDRRIRVHRVVFLGSPNTGTPMATHAAFATWIDVLTNVLSWVGGAFGSLAGAAVAELVKARAAARSTRLPGLTCMIPGSTFMQGLNPGGPPLGCTYRAIASNHDAPLTQPHWALVDLALDPFFGHVANDLVVPTNAVWSASAFPVALADRRDASPLTHHLSYLLDVPPREQVISWLSGG